MPDTFTRHVKSPYHGICHNACQNLKGLPLLLFHQLTVILLCFMTTGLTAAAIIGFCKLYGQLPVTERHGLPDIFRQDARMNLMASPAGSSIRCPVYVNEMKVAIAVAKSGQGCSALILRQPGIVAAETESISRRKVRRVKLLWVIVCQKTEIG